MINKNQRKIIMLILLLFSVSMMISSVYAAEKTLTPSKDIKTEIKKVPSGSVIKLDPSKGEFSISSSISINKIVTIQSSNPSKNAIINLDKNLEKYGNAFNIANGGKLTLKNIIIKNGDSGLGGVIYNNGTVTLNRCTFTKNTAKYGGAIYNRGTITLTRCTFTKNTATSYGGAIYSDGTLTAKTCIFTENTANYGGGATYNYNGRATLTDCIFTKNTATDYGGAINNGYASTLTAKTCIFTENTANYGGGAIYNENTLTAKTCTFTKNTAKNGDYLGAIYKMKGSKTTITDCTFGPSKSANLKLDKVTTSKPTTKNGKKIYTKVYNYKNFGKAIGSKTFTITIDKKYKLLGKITKSAKVSSSYNSKTKKITVAIKKLAYNKIAQVKFKIIQI